MAQPISMTQGAPWKHILKFAFPVLLGALLQQLYNTADAIIVGNFCGESSLSAVGTTGSFVFFFLAAAIGFSNGSCVVTAQFFGAGENDKVRGNAATGILLLLAMGAALSIMGIFLSRVVFAQLISVPESILEETLGYFRIYAAGLVFQFGYNIFSAILRAVGDSAASMYFLLISSVLNIILDLAFVAGFHWGTKGAALATDLAQFISFAAAYYYMRHKYEIFRFSRKDYKWNKQYIAMTVKVGAPIALQLMIVALGHTLIQRAVNEFGQSMTASFTAAQRVEMYINMPSHTMQTTLAAYTGQNAGAGKMDRVKLGLKQGMIISVTITAVISALLRIWSDPIIAMFGISGKAAGFCSSHLMTLTIVNIILALYVPLFGTFQGTGHSSFPAFVATTALGTRVLTTYLFRYSPYFGYTIIWWNAVFGFGAGCLVSWIYLFSGKWQKNTLKPQ